MCHVTVCTDIRNIFHLKGLVGLIDRVNRSGGSFNSFFLPGPFSYLGQLEYHDCRYGTSLLQVSLDSKSCRIHLFRFAVQKNDIQLHQLQQYLQYPEQQQSNNYCGNNRPRPISKKLLLCFAAGFPRLTLRRTSLGYKCQKGECKRALGSDRRVL